MGVWAATLKALYAVYSGSSAAADPRKTMGLRFYLDQAHGDETFPYAVYKVVGSERSGYYGGNAAEELTVDVLIFSDYADASQIVALADAFDALYGGANLAPSGMQGCSCQRIGPAIGPTLDEEGIWQMTLTFAVRVSAT